MHSSIREAPSPSRLRGPLLLALAVVGLVAAGLALRAPWQRRQSPSQAAPQRAFYYWKTQWAAGPGLSQVLAENRASRLYLRFFDVDWDQPTHTALPLSPLQHSAPLPTGIEIIPVVFIANRVFHNTADADVEALAAHVLHKVDQMAAADGITPQEVQLDCDWSDATRRRYFHFVAVIQRQLHARKVQLSSTIRLHQIKYAARTGVPPVDRGMLMFYNFGPLRADAPRSSIFNVEDAQRYASYVASYSLPLDLALPLFSWSVHCRDGSVLGLIEKLEAGDIEGTGGFTRLATGRYRASRSLFFRGRYFLAGDELTQEETTPATTMQAAVTAAAGAGRDKPFATVAFFDLDERNLRHYAASDFQRILAVFH